MISFGEGFTPLVECPLNGRAMMKLDFLWAALCLTGAVYFIFRS